MSSVNAPVAQAPPILHLSSVVGSPLRDADGERLGTAEDVIVRLGGAGYPPITGFLVNVAGRTSYLGVDRVSDIGADGVVLRKAKLDLRRFERRPDEVLLRRDVLDRQLINVEGARLVRANEIELAHLGGSWRVVGVDTGPRGGLRRLLPKRLGSRIATGEFLDWAGVEPFVGHVPTVRLRVPHPKLAKLHPAQIADLVEAASRREGEEIIQAVGDVASPDGALQGAVPVTALLRAEPGQRLEALVKHEIPCLSPDASFEEVARLMADYNLTAIPVADEHERMVGVVTVDDVLEAMLPRGWRRRFGLLGED